MRNETANLHSTRTGGHLWVEKVVETEDGVIRGTVQILTINRYFLTALSYRDSTMDGVGGWLNDPETYLQSHHMAPLYLVRSFRLSVSVADNPFLCLYLV